MANPKIEVEVGARTAEFQRKFGQVNDTLRKSGKEFNTFANFAKGALAGIAAGISIQAIIGIGRAILDTTATFQKFNAVLTNTLGSSEAASTAFNQIKDFASNTPFQVDELTGAFVKLANQGFKPTINELRSLGDLAASTGKTFDQLAEAVIDAQVGEFERLKEFGIRASKSGDDVTFTFKGVETQVKATDEAIRGYILSLGDAEGVSGATAAISETLGGKLSNLTDNITNLQFAIGDQTSGVYATTIDWLNDFIKKAELVVRGVDNIRAAVQDSTIANVIQANRDEVERLAEAYQRIDPQVTTQQALAKAIADVSRGFREAAKGGEAFRNQSYTISELNKIIEGFNQYAIEVFNVSTNTDKAALSLEEFSKIQDGLNKLVFQQFAEDTNKFNSELEETIRLRNEIASLSTGIVESNNVNPSTGIVEFGNLAQGFDPVENADVFIEQNQRVQDSNLLLIESFSALGTQIGNSLNISNDALKGFVTTLISSTPKIIAAIIAQAQAQKAASAITNQANAQQATGNAIVVATSAAKGLGPVGLALLPAFIGGAVALISGAFGKGGGGGGGSVGSSVSGSTFEGSGATGFSSNRELSGELVVRGQDLVYVFGQAQTKIAKG